MTMLLSLVRSVQRKKRSTEADGVFSALGSLVQEDLENHIHAILYILQQKPQLRIVEWRRERYRERVQKKNSAAHSKNIMFTPRIMDFLDKHLFI